MANWLNAEYALVRTARRIVRGLRRLATRILLVQIHAELDELRQRQDSIERQLNVLLGRHYDNLAVAQRLASLEDHVRELQETDALREEVGLPRKG